MKRLAPSYHVRELAYSEVMQAQAKGLGGTHSLLPEGVTADEFSFKQRYADALYRFCRDVRPEDYDRYLIYLVQWFGTNVPQGINVGGTRIDAVQHGIAYHLKSPDEPDPRKWEWEEVGTYERIYDEIPSGNAYSNHGMVLFVAQGAPREVNQSG